MAVPAHDTRDYEFATKYNIPICWVVKPDGEDCCDSGKAYAGEGYILNSSNLTLGLHINGLPSKVAASKVVEWAEKTGNGKKKVLVTVNLKLTVKKDSVGSGIVTRFSKYGTIHVT